MDRKRAIAAACLAWALFEGLTPDAAHADPTQVNATNTCLSCHAPTAAAALTFLDINGAAASGPPWGVTLTAGSNFNFIYRSTGLYTTTTYPDTGGAVIPPDTVNWVVYQGGTWTDNGESGSTPWTAPNTLFYETDYPASDNNLGVVGLTANNGSSMPPVDMNRIASNEVMSASVSVSASLAPGTYTLTVAAMGNNGSPVSVSQPFSVYIVAPSRTPSVTPAVSPTPTQSPVPAGSSPTDTPTPSPSFTVSPTFTVTRSFSASPTALPSAVSGAVSGLSFPDINQLVLEPNPARQSGAKAFFHLLAGAQDVQAQVYDQGLTLVRHMDLGPRPGGWNTVALPVLGLPPQLYFVVLHVLQGPYNRRSPTAVLYLLP
jgi:hypothetical protein